MFLAFESTCCRIYDHLVSPFSVSLTLVKMKMSHRVNFQSYFDCMTTDGIYGLHSKSHFDHTKKYGDSLNFMMTSSWMNEGGWELSAVWFGVCLCIFILFYFILFLVLWVNIAHLILHGLIYLFFLILWLHFCNFIGWELPCISFRLIGCKS